MNKVIILGMSILLLAGCAAPMQPAVQAYAAAVQQQTQTGQELLKRCQTGNDQPACTGVNGVLSSIAGSAKVLQQGGTK